MHQGVTKRGTAIDIVHFLPITFIKSPVGIAARASPTVTREITQLTSSEVSLSSSLSFMLANTGDTQKNERPAASNPVDPLKHTFIQFKFPKSLYNLTDA